MNKLTKWVLTLLLLSLSWTAQAQASSQLEQDLTALRAWMQQKASQADETIRAEWPTVKQEFKELSYTLDRNTKKLSDSSRAEYNSIKQRYQQWEERNETRKAVDLEGPELARWERAMTGTTQIAKIKPARLRDAYLQLLTYTREQRRNWSLRDWDYAEFVFGELNTRKAEVLDYLHNSDKIKIAALQVEFATLKKSREAKDMYHDMREDKR